MVLELGEGVVWSSGVCFEYACCRIVWQEVVELLVR